MTEPPISMSEGKDYDASDLEKKSVDDNVAYHDGLSPNAVESGELHRQLKNRHAQMISIGQLIFQLDGT